MIPVAWRHLLDYPVELAAVMGTAVVISAATSFLCTRSYFLARLNRRQFASSIASRETKAAVAPIVEVPSTKPYDELSYLCTECGVNREETASSKAPAVRGGPVKMVILVRADLNMGKGKAAAQCCHAVLAAFKSAQQRFPDFLKKWEREGQPKVALKIESEKEMNELLNQARLAGICAESIRDAGRTQVASGTRTVCAIGPAPASLIDTVTGHLKLY